MIGKLPENSQRDLFRPMLKDFINPHHELVLLSDTIDWQYFENEFKPYYSEKGAPSVPIRVMVDCLMLKHLYNLGDERIPEYWVRDVYFQYFCGGVFFAHKFPYKIGNEVIPQCKITNGSIDKTDNKYLILRRY